MIRMTYRIGTQKFESKKHALKSQEVALLTKRYDLTPIFWLTPSMIDTHFSQKFDSLAPNFLVKEHTQIDQNYTIKDQSRQIFTQKFSYPED